ncbi:MULTISPECIES: hypothetical protein [unclassified Exiguobacterium]|uniref:hypothetical protein n=1 Tax=unclassified Exiguobacterium TaxID=2644629 RepID=UPI001BE735B6|nr:MULTISPECIES: hypothetical protein [unclassified Exiguobacterium]
MSERKSYLQLMGEGFRMLKQSKQTDTTVSLRNWTFTIHHDHEWYIVLRTSRIKWIGLPTTTFLICPDTIQIGDLKITRHEESNEVRLTIDEEWGLENKVVCDNLEWETFVDALKRVKGE